MSLKISGFVFKLCKRKNLDVTISGFIASTLKIIIIVMVAIIALGKLGISVAPFVAAIGVMSLGAGLNIILARPFVVGDTIHIQGVIGQVKEVHLAYTLLSDEDDVEITIPNKHIVGEIIQNSYENTLAEENIGIAYDSDINKAISVIQEALTSTEKVSKTRKPLVGIEDFADSAINIGIRFWVPTKSYFEVRYLANTEIYSALLAADVTIPYPQREIRILKKS